MYYKKKIKKIFSLLKKAKRFKLRRVIGILKKSILGYTEMGTFQITYAHKLNQLSDI